MSDAHAIAIAAAILLSQDARGSLDTARREKDAIDTATRLLAAGKTKEAASE
jgi:hypothetical protein